MSLRKLLPVLPFALLLAAAGCATHVAVPSSANSVAVYQWGALKGDVKGDLTAVFNATNASLDKLGYFRVGQEVSKTEIYVYARGVKDVKVTVHLVPSKVDGATTVSIEVGDGNLPKSQEIFSTLTAQLGSA